MFYIPNLYFNITDLQIPVIRETSNSSIWKVKTGKPVQWRCYVTGMPPPTISWFKVNIVVYYLNELS